MADKVYGGFSNGEYAELLKYAKEKKLEVEAHNKHGTIRAIVAKATGIQLEEKKRSGSAVIIRKDAKTGKEIKLMGRQIEAMMTLPLTEKEQLRKLLGL